MSENEFDLTQYHLGFSHGVLAGTGIYCLTQIKGDDTFPCQHMIFGFITVHNLLAACLSFTDFGYSMVLDITRFFKYCQNLFTIPCLATAMWLTNGYSKEASWAWTAIPAVHLVYYTINSSADYQLIEMLNLCGLVAEGSLSYMKNITAGMYAGAAFLVSQIMQNRGEFWFPFANYGLCVYCFFALQAMSGKAT